MDAFKKIVLSLKILTVMAASVFEVAHAQSGTWSNSGEATAFFQRPASADQTTIINNINNNRDEGDANSAFEGSNSNLVAIGVDSVNWQQTPEQISYEIDPNTLALTVKYEYNLQLKASLRLPPKDPNDPNAMPIEKSVPPGKYLLRIGVFLNGNAAAQYSKLNQFNRNLLIKERLVSWTEKVVTVHQGGIVKKAKIVLPFKAQTATIMANHILFELTELKDQGTKWEEKNIVELSRKEPIILAASFVPFREQANPVPQESPFPWKKLPKKLNTLGELINDGLLLQAHKDSNIPRYKAPVNAAMAFAKSANLKFLNLNSSEIQALYNLPFMKPSQRNKAAPKQMSTYKKTFVDFFKTQDSNPVELYKQGPVVALMCSLLAKRGGYEQSIGALPDCVRYPHRYLRVGKNVHVGAIGDTKVILPQRIEDGYDVSSNFAVCRSHSEDSSATWSINPFGLLVKLFESTGIPSPVNRSYSISESNGRSKSQCMSVNQNTHLEVTGIVAPIELKRFLTCISVMPVKGNPYESKNQSDNGFYICNTKEEQNVTVFEDYIHIYEPLTPKTMVAYNTPSQDKPNFAFRGGRDYVAFIHGLRTGIRPDITQSEGPDNIVTAARAYLESTPMTIPNVISIPVELKSSAISAPTFWKKVLLQYEETFD